MLTGDKKHSWSTRRDISLVNKEQPNFGQLFTKIVRDTTCRQYIVNYIIQLVEKIKTDIAKGVEKNTNK